MLVSRADAAPFLLEERSSEIARELSACAKVETDPPELSLSRSNVVCAEIETEDKEGLAEEPPVRKL